VDATTGNRIFGTVVARAHGDLILRSARLSFIFVLHSNYYFLRVGTSPPGSEPKATTRRGDSKTRAGTAAVVRRRCTCQENNRLGTPENAIRNAPGRLDFSYSLGPAVDRRLEARQTITAVRVPVVYSAARLLDGRGISVRTAGPLVTEGFLPGHETAAAFANTRRSSPTRAACKPSARDRLITASGKIRFFDSATPSLSDVFVDGPTTKTAR